jgi:hypothetical protein
MESIQLAEVEFTTGSMDSRVSTAWVTKLLLRLFLLLKFSKEWI